MKKIIKALKVQGNPLTLWTLFLRGLGVLLLFAISFLMTNNFSPSVVGEYEFIRVFLLVLGSLCLLGTDVSILYFSGKLKSINNFLEIKDIYWRVIKIISVSSIFCFSVYYILLTKTQVNAFFGEGYYQIILNSLIFLIFYVITLFNTEILRAINKPIISELFRNIFKYLPLGIGILVHIYYKGFLILYEYFVYGFLILFIASQLTVIYCFNTIGNSELRFFSTKEVLRISLPMGISNIIIFLLLSIDVFLLKRNYGSEYVAFYAIGIKLVTILSVVMISININVSQQIAQYFSSNDKEALQCLTRKTAQKMFLANFIITIILVLFINQILLAFGEKYMFVKEAFYVLISSQLFASAFGATPVYLNMTGRGKIYQSILITTLIVNLVLNSFLIPKYNLMGAAYTFLITIVFWNIFTALYIYKKDKINVFIY